MTERKHTPGPWAIKGAPVRLGMDYAITAIVDGEILLIAEAFVEVAEKIAGPSYANASLIAAAPELLKALEGLYDAADSALHLTPEKLQAASDAITKAKGQ